MAVVYRDGMAVEEILKEEMQGVMPLSSTIVEALVTSYGETDEDKAIWTSTDLPMFFNDNGMSAAEYAIFEAVCKAALTTAGRAASRPCS